MNSERKITRIAGILFIAATMASLLGSSLTGPLLDAPDYLSSVASHVNRLLAGELLSVIAASTSVSIAIWLYPILKKYDDRLALGAVCFRLIEAVFYMVGALCMLLLITLSQQFMNAGGQNVFLFDTVGHLLQTMSDLAGFVFGVIAFCLGGAMYNVVFYQSKLIPRWLSAWGIIALVSLLAAVSITLFDGEPYSISGNLVFLAAPLALQEMVLAVWLIAKGFNPSVIASKAAISAANAPVSAA